MYLHHFRAVQKVLSNKKETQELSNELTVHVLTVGIHNYNIMIIVIQTYKAMIYMYTSVYIVRGYNDKES